MTLSARFTLCKLLRTMKEIMSDSENVKLIDRRGKNRKFQRAKCKIGVLWVEEILKLNLHPGNNFSLGTLLHIMQSKAVRLLLSRIITF